MRNEDASESGELDCGDCGTLTLCGLLWIWIWTVIVDLE